MKKTRITGITGQDGASLSKFLLEKGYVYGTYRRLSTPNFWRVEEVKISDTNYIYNLAAKYGKSF